MGRQRVFGAERSVSWLRKAAGVAARLFAIATRLMARAPWRAALLAATVAALITGAPGEALAQAPATITKSFSPSTIELNGTSIMTVTVTNPNGTPLTTVAFSDTMPAGLALITQTGGTCSTPATGGGMFSINPGAGTFSSTSTVLAPAQSCNITVQVRGIATGLITNTTSTVTSNEAGPGGPASANIQVNAPGTPSTVQQVPLDSIRLRALQIAITKLAALTSGDAFGSAVAGAIADGFADGGNPLAAPGGNGLRFNFAAEPDAAGRVADRHERPAGMLSFAPDPSASARVDDAFAALAYAGPMPTKAPPLLPRPKEWQAWADVRGTGWTTDPSAGDLRGGQINAIAGVTRKLTPDFLVGFLGGYENFDYTSQTLNGKLKGDGWTVGGYLGWRLWPGVRFDAAVGRSGISYSGTSGTAAASFPGNRWLATAGLTGLYRTPRLEIEPSTRVHAVWERDNAYIDSLGTSQAENTFSTGRASSGVKVAHPILWDAETIVAPYAGLYADYYFSSSNAELQCGGRRQGDGRRRSRRAWQPGFHHLVRARARQRAVLSRCAAPAQKRIKGYFGVLDASAPDFDFVSFAATR
jgi:uncharacterized repeat protein (TIGR01451 family)